MFDVLILGLLFVYFWYFYTDYSKPVSKPAGAPLIAKSLKPYFDMQHKHEFFVKVNGQVKWHHALPTERYVLGNQQVRSKDVCYGIEHGKQIEAKGESLYNYLQNQPDSTFDLLSFHDTPYAVRTGQVYYFTCVNNRIDRLNICPSGKIFQNGRCKDINMCTGQPDGTKFAGRTITTYVKCRSGRQTKVMSCPPNKFFYHNRCVQMEDLAHRCKFFGNVPLLLDEKTRIECRDGKPVRVECGPGYRFFDKDYCESDRCVGRRDHTRLPMPQRLVEPFRFTPGYWECVGGKVSQTVECPSTWNDSLSKGDNLTFLPMVFGGQECSAPTFGENVFSQDPDVLVPLYEFTRILKNWKLADLYDRAAGYDNDRKRRILPPNMRISKRFKPEDVCQAGKLLPVHEQYDQYYDCDQRAVVDCPKDEYFNGAKCVVEPLFAFKFGGLPIFSFDSLDFDEWIAPPDYKREDILNCSNNELLIMPYNICSHPDCVHYDFLSMIPDLSMLLPKQAKCRFDEASRRLVKEEVHFPYSFWTQKLTADSDTCTPGQPIQTGNFIWDSTVFATCDPNQPFVFCPSVQSLRTILEYNGVYACTPPFDNKVLFNSVDWTLFATNELKRIFPIAGNPSQVKLNKAYKDFTDVPPDGLEIPMNTKINLQIKQPVVLEFRFRVTYPPNVVFEYGDNEMTPRIGPPHTGFLVKVPIWYKKGIMHELAHGVLFYASLYTNGILLMIGVTTGRSIFVLLILLTLGLTAYLMYMLSHDAEHLKKVGTWAEKTFATQLEKLKRFF